MAWLVTSEAALASSLLRSSKQSTRWGHKYVGSLVVSLTLVDITL